MEKIGNGNKEIERRRSVEKCEAVNDLIELKKTRNWKYYYRGENFGR